MAATQAERQPVTPAQRRWRPGGLGSVSDADPLAKTVGRAARAASDHRLSFVCGRDEHPLKTRVVVRSWVPKALIPYPVEPGSPSTGLVNGELCRRVGIQPRVSNRHTATDRQTIRPITEPLLSTVQRRQPIAQALCNRIVNPLGGQRLSPVVCVTLLILSRTVLVDRCLAIRQHRLDLGSFGPQSLFRCVRVHWTSPVWGCCNQSGL